MSQAGINNNSLNPPEVPTTFTADDLTTATPAANNLNVFSADTTANNDNGIRTIASLSTLTVQLTNRGTSGTVTTTDATLTTVATFSLGATPGVYFIQGDFIGFDITDTAGGGYGFDSAFRTTGAAAVEISTEFKDLFEEAAMATSDVFVVASGNNVLFQVQGIAAKTIDWNCVFNFRFVS